MSIIILLKVLHYLGLFFAGGLGVAGGVIQAVHKRRHIPPGPEMQSVMALLGYLSLGAIIVLWVTGLGLAVLIYSSFSLGWAFHLKLAGATALLLVISWTNLHMASSRRNSRPPEAQKMRLAVSAARLSLLAVLFGIAVTTSL